MEGEASKLVTGVGCTTSCSEKAKRSRKVTDRLVEHY